MILRIAITTCVLVLTATVASAQNWIFSAAPFTHDPATGARVAQYAQVAPVEDLPDPRAVTSSYRRTQTNIRGADGSLDSTYQVQSWGNGRGGIDAQWERFHDAWQQSFLTGSYFNQNGGFGGFGQGGYGAPGFGGGYGAGPGFGPGFGYGGAPGYGPGYGYAPGPGYGYRPWPGYGRPGYRNYGPHHGPRHPRRRPGWMPEEVAP